MYKQNKNNSSEGEKYEIKQKLRPFPTNFFILLPLNLIFLVCYVLTRTSPTIIPVSVKKITYRFQKLCQFLKFFVTIREAAIKSLFLNGRTIKRRGGGVKGQPLKKKYFSQKIGGRKKMSKSVSGYCMTKKIQLPLSPRGGRVRH